MHVSTYPVGAKWHIMASGVGSENMVYLVAKENPKYWNLITFGYVTAYIVLVK